MSAASRANRAPVAPGDTPFLQFKAAMDDPRIGTKFPKERFAFNAILMQFMHLIAMIFAFFAFDPVSLAVAGVGGYAITATCYSDYYKLSMAPTIHYLQKLRGGRAVVRFALDIRDKNLRDMFAANTDGITTAVIQALNALQNRTFDYQVILDTVAGKPFEAFSYSPEGRALFLNADSTPRTLISTTSPHGVSVYEGTVICSVPILDPTVLAPGQVVISVFLANDAKTGERRLHVEAAGDESHASFLETTMMQVVYETVLNHHLSKRRCSFGKWLYEALFRFYLSATFAGTDCPGMTGFLFAGRRTGHFLLLLLQAFLAKKIPGAKIAGTSSFDAVHFLTNKLRLTDIIGSVGTHAHEIQMLAQSLYAWLDKHAGNPEHLPLSACVSTYLYYLTAHQGKPGPMPMLPDTLGTRAFCKAAACFMVRPMKDGVLMEGFVPLLSLINSARQDSGDIGKFAQIVHQHGFKGSLMASEVDNKEKLNEACGAGYVTYGTGGFMGDSEKVWDVTDSSSEAPKKIPALTASMAVKLVDVWLVTKSPCGTAEVFEKCPPPCKLGDGTDPAKVTADALLPKPMYDQFITDAELVKSSAETKPDSDHQFFCEVDLASFGITVIRDPGTANQVILN